MSKTRNKPITIATIMDPLPGLAYHKDFTLGLLHSAQSRGWKNYVIMREDLYTAQGVPKCSASEITVQYDPENYYQMQPKQRMDLAEFDVISMRLDPPFDLEYITITWMLQILQEQGVLVVNNPQALRDLNEKFSISRFAHLTPKTFISPNIEEILAWLEHEQNNNHAKCVIKPLDGMGGREIFQIARADANCKVIIESVTRNGTKTVMVQHFVPEIVDGDKRVWIIDGEPYKYMLARIPHGDSRGNLDKGARAILQKTGATELAIGAEVGVLMKKAGVLFAGIDVIGDKLTEINITSPTGLRALDEVGIDGGGLVIDAIEKYL